MPRSNKTPEEHAREKWARKHATLKRFAAMRSAEEGDTAKKMVSTINVVAAATLNIPRTNLCVKYRSS
jgi:hypothetical protein